MPNDGSAKSPSPTSDRPALKHSLARRRLLKSLAAGSVVVGAHVVPDRWVKPVVDVVVVPAHAQASGPSMTAFLTFSPPGTQVNGPATTTVDGALASDDMDVAGQATLVNPPVPGQAVTLSFAINNGGTDLFFDADTFPQSVASNPGTGVATFANLPLDLDDTGASSDSAAATLTATFSSPGVPSVVITVDFA